MVKKSPKSPAKPTNPKKPRAPKAPSAYEKMRQKRGTAGENLAKILMKPKKDKYPPSRINQVYGANQVHQADLLYLPYDADDKQAPRLALVVVDAATRLADAEPVTPIRRKKADGTKYRYREADQTLKAFQRIYKRKILSFPESMLQVDNGAEFKGKTKEHFEKQNVIMKYGLPGRSRQQAFAETRNQIIGKLSAEEQTNVELATGERFTEWASMLPDIVAAMNEMNEQTPADPTPELTKPKTKSLAPKCTKSSCELLDVGTKVRRPLDKPTDPLTDAPLQGGFRSTDLRFENKIRTIKQVILKPNQVPMYRLSSLPSDSGKLKNLKTTAYTKGQLQVVRDSGAQPDIRKVGAATNTGVPLEIISKRTVKGKVYYLVKWKGFDKPEETSAASLKGFPELTKAFRAKSRKR
jgi:hypothetical protein